MLWCLISWEFEMLFLRFWKSIWESWSWFRSCGIWFLSVRSMFIFIGNLLLIFWEVVFRLGGRAGEVCGFIVG